ncbi:sulfotransferase domain-containing protein [Bacillus sp. V2I10]|uniref:sulfotransferase domain-containing protein n=1 Tax=Bacillus sp. V2I10 TaxID=3042276 RepID=UPI002786BACD|nr:sulfotransferase domain-containing protein [Bacillus sp. V2I10]MDQ0857348.1 hypothetical protein [Bacillus sp. V2I10]
MKKLPKVLLLGIPECGVSTLNEIVHRIPFLRSGKWLNQWEEEVCGALKGLNSGEVWTGYVYYSGEVMRYLEDNQIRRIFIYRDPRDMILSYLFYILNDDKHIHHKYFTEHLDCLDEQIKKMITGFYESGTIAKQYGQEAIGYGSMNDHYLPYLRWLEDPNTCVIRYENLIDDNSKSSELNKIIDYLWEDIKEEGFSKEDYLRLFEDAQFYKNIKKDTSNEWVKYFSEEIKEIFKEEAGELLIYLGYESDLKW